MSLAETPAVETPDVAPQASVHERVKELLHSITAIEKEAFEIDRIAQQVNILAINASIEAQRAGQAGRGFAVVASAINDLSQSTRRTTDEVSSRLKDLRRTASELVADGDKQA